MSTDRPHVRTEPGIRFGAPHIRGRSVEVIAGAVLGEKDVDAVADDYDMTRGEVLVACWHAGIYGEPRHRRLWGDWADQVYPLLAAGAGYRAIPDPPVDVEPAPELTAREEEILTLVAAGHTNPAIARRLDISIATACTHLRRVLAKLDARNRAHAVARGYELGLLGGGR